MPSSTSRFLAETGALLAKDWRCELRTRSGLGAVALFSLSTLCVIGLGLGPLGVATGERATVLPTLLWILLLFAAAAGLPRAFAREEESHTATALRLAARPAAVFCGKLLYALTLLLALELLVVPLFVAMVQLPIVAPLTLLAGLLAGGYGLATGSTLVAAIAAQARGKGTLFSVLAFPILVPLLLLAIELTRAAVTGAPAEGVLRQILLYDGSVTVAGLMLFPAVWNP
jgi:heme exporter protein B